MFDDTEEIEHTEETDSEELETQETDDVDTDEGAEEPQTPETPPSEEPTVLMSAFKKYAKEYGLDGQDFASKEDPEEFAKRTMQQMKGFIDLSKRLEEATRAGLPSPLAPQDVPQVVPSAEDGAVDELLSDPQGYLGKFMAQRDQKAQEQAYQIEVFRQDQAINQWATTLPPQEVAQILPSYKNDPVIRLKRATGQVITLQDAQAAYEHARMVAGNIQKVRQDALSEGEAAADAKRRAGLETGKKRSGQAPVMGLDALVDKYGIGEIPDDLLKAAIAAEEAA